MDNSKVSYSNPVRQSLFTFADCLDGGSPKSRAAAESVTRIFPGMVCYLLLRSAAITLWEWFFQNASAYQLNIPMPGHSVHENIRAKVLETIETLEDLIAKNDAIFLLMDTRESRWLPTVLGASQRKVIAAVVSSPRREQISIRQVMCLFVFTFSSKVQRVILEI